MRLVTFLESYGGVFVVGVAHLGTNPANNLVVENHDQRDHKSGDLFLCQTAQKICVITLGKLTLVTVGKTLHLEWLFLVSQGVPKR